MSEKPSVSVLISVLDQKQYTRRCLNALEETLRGKFLHEILIADDCSGDDTKQFLQSLGDPHRVLFNDERKGFAVNNNLLAQEARGEFLCFLNNDVFVEGDWLMPMLDVLRERENVGMVGNVQKLADSIRYDHMGVVFGPRGNPRHFGQGFLHRPFKGQVREWSAVTAACCVARREVFLETGGFDEVFLNGCEDVDLCLRMVEKGFSNYVVHDSVVRHVKCASYGRLDHNLENEAKFLERWRERISCQYFPRDRLLYAYSYLLRSLLNPLGLTMSLLLESLYLLISRSRSK